MYWVGGWVIVFVDVWVCGCGCTYVWLVAYRIVGMCECTCCATVSPSTAPLTPPTLHHQAPHHASPPHTRYHRLPSYNIVVAHALDQATVQAAPFVNVEPFDVSNGGAPVTTCQGLFRQQTPTTSVLVCCGDMVYIGG